MSPSSNCITASLTLSCGKTRSFSAMMTGANSAGTSRWQVRVQTRARQNPAGRHAPVLLMVVFQSSFIAAQLFFDALDRLLEACVNISVIAGGVQIKAAVEVQRTIGLKAIP